MTIEVNGKTMEHVEGETITALLKRMNYVFPLIVVKIDGQLVKEPEYPTTVVPDGSEVKIVHLISGG